MARKCEACPAMVEFIRGPSGRWIPVQRIKSVYLAETGPDDKRPVLRPLQAVEAARQEGRPVYISHFETCPKASNFGGGRGHVEGG